MRKYFLAAIMSFGALSAVEETCDIESIWDSDGVYVKYGAGAVLLPVFPTLGFGYYARVGAGAIDFSVMDSTLLFTNILDVKLLALPVVKDQFQIGIGPTYLMMSQLVENNPMINSFGVGLLFRKVNPSKLSFFQAELNISVVNVWKGGFSKNWHTEFPGVALMWGNRF